MNLAAIAQLAQLDLTPEESAAMERDLGAILDYIAQLQRIPTEGVAAMTQAQMAETPLRPDQARPWFTAAEALANAPAQRLAMFEVPKILG